MCVDISFPFDLVFFLWSSYMLVDVRVILSAVVIVVLCGIKLTIASESFSQSSIAFERNATGSFMINETNNIHTINSGKKQVNSL